MTTIFDKIEEAEKLGQDELIEIKASDFLDLIDLRLICGFLVNAIQDEEKEAANGFLIQLMDKISSDRQAESD